MLLLGGLLVTACGSGKDRGIDPVAQVLSQGPVPDFTKLDSSQCRTYDGGLKICPLRVGPGSRPIDGMQVKMHYKGRLGDGTEFGDTWKSAEPFSFVLGQTGLIPGMEAAVRKIRFGTQALVVIPPALGYTKDNTPPNIPAGSTLIYELELLGNI